MDTASAPEARPSSQHRDTVKAEPCTEDEREQHLQQLSRPQDVVSSVSALDFLALWRPSAVPPSRYAATLTSMKQAAEVKGAQSSSPTPPLSALAIPTHVSDQRLGTLSIGSVVFAPCRVRSERQVRGGPSACASGGTASGFSPTATAHQPMSPPPPPCHLHYALAEVTGIQVMAGTVTVSFLFTDPGIDDEAVSMYECVPCPPACLSRWLREGNSPAPPRCSLLERVLHVTPQDGPLPVNDVYRALHAPSTTLAFAPGLSPLPVQRQLQQERCVARLRQLYCLSDDDDEQPRTTIARTCNGVGQGPSGHDTAAKPAALEPIATTATPSPDACRHLSTGTADKAGLPTSSAEATALATLPATIFARYVATTSVHVFFSGIFQQVNAYMEQRCSHRLPRSLTAPATEPSSPARPLRRSGLGARAASPPPLVLVIFDNYATLRRFHVFMAVRGHVVQLLDGTHVGNSLPSPQTSHAFGAQCKVWLCMLRDDTGEESVEEEARKEDSSPMTKARGNEARAEAAQAVACMEAQLRRLLGVAPPVDALVSFKEHVTHQKQVAEHHPSVTLHQHVTAEAVLQRLMPHLEAVRLVCVLQDVPAPPSPRPTPTGNSVDPSSVGTNQPQPSTAPTAASTTVVKVSGAVFGDNKVLVPCSPEQLTLLSTVWASTPAAGCKRTNDGGVAQRDSEAAAQPKGSSSTKAARKRPRVAETADTSSEATAARAQALTPALLERIALGSFTDAAAASLFDVFADATAVVVKAPDPSPGVISATAGDAHRGSGDQRGAAEMLSSIEDLYEKWCVDPSRFGEAFPVFAAVYALVADIFASASCFRFGRAPDPGGQAAGIRDDASQRFSTGPLESAPPPERDAGATAPAAQPPTPNKAPHRRTGAPFGALPRIALVLPRGNPTHHPSLGAEQYLRTLRAFFSPWAVHEITSSVSSAAFSCAAPLLWYQRGGLLLLFCDEATTQLGALQDEADVVIACGKAAAAWVAANSATRASSGDFCSAAVADPVLFAVISEAEVVAPADHLTHLWLPITLASPACIREGHASTSADRLERGSEWPLMSHEETSRTELEEIWRLLLATVSADGSVDVPARPSSPLLQQHKQPHGQTLRGAGAVGRRLHQLEALPRTLRQAVVLWRHLQSPRGNMSGKLCQSCASPSELDREGPWGTLQATVKEMALRCVTATPVRMADVTLICSSSDRV
ncbi:hypothetical protein CUR178_06039 [Leishmania enriettii]|uniref:Uncharacterized protein n=1 Tax=Leishmania enriettii TaxID=5663 RepID=A0A836KTH3_LEIEN|nr:hypothetical protein CUR178_06039 [Leishmania enriettii]